MHPAAAAVRGPPQRGHGGAAGRRGALPRMGARAGLELRRRSAHQRARHRPRGVRAGLSRRGLGLRLLAGLAGVSGRHPGGGVTVVPMGAKTVRQSVRRRRVGAGIPCRAIRAVPEEFAQS